MSRKKNLRVLLTSHTFVVKYTHTTRLARRMAVALAVFGVRTLKNRNRQHPECGELEVREIRRWSTAEINEYHLLTAF